MAPDSQLRRPEISLVAWLPELVARNTRSNWSNLVPLSIRLSQLKKCGVQTWPSSPWDSVGLQPSQRPVSMVEKCFTHLADILVIFKS
jgi:hypothetical protein